MLRHNDLGIGGRFKFFISYSYFPVITNYILKPAGVLL